MLSAPAASFSPNMTVLSQVLALPSDTANDGQTRLSVPKHSQTSQEARKTRFDWSQVSSWGLAAGGEALSISRDKMMRMSRVMAIPMAKAICN